MHTTTTLLSTLVLASSTLAAAVPAAALTPRACAIETPTLLTRLDRSNPDLAIGSVSYAWANPTISTEVQFSNIPAGAFGCQLEIFFPPRYVVDNSGDSRAYFYSLDREVSPSDTFNNAPAKVSLIGTADVRSDYARETRIVVNSVQCKPSLGFRMDVAEGKVGSLGFNNLDGFGFRLTHNC
ncbi:uncharacterized protein K452DRAFT_359004 [Aplosporella prunicola CBS 121167]|uniref:Ubiquitin 3 binding protein But2 C-terminal domain-containing protein n=1 Tax=Aplosporella prunicola CBS 121167 TaxID=1176127 RepID=A0A6A6BAS7_9PEZI|nr:uncharacterized protein K452DRAFT_359004 [Aplosporella prunicola CBS 121167]KAF2141200.1 hypothetical protein K452DRAFT_359004 [Aplosporella prunicola CBS 121167]